MGPEIITSRINRIKPDDLTVSPTTFKQYLFIQNSLFNQDSENMSDQSKACEKLPVFVSLYFAVVTFSWSCDHVEQQKRFPMPKTNSKMWCPITSRWFWLCADLKLTWSRRYSRWQFFGVKNKLVASVNMNGSELPHSHTNDDVGATGLSAFTLQPGLISVKATDTNWFIWKELGVASDTQTQVLERNAGFKQLGLQSNPW